MKKVDGDLDHVWNGVRLALGAVAGVCTMILLGYGFDKLRFPEVDNSLFTFWKDYPPRLVGGLCVTAAFAILWISVNRWAKMLPGLFAYAVLGGLLAVAGGGFHSHVASLRLTRLESAIVTILYAACAFLTMRLGTGKLKWTDRVAALSAPLLFTYAATSSAASSGFKALAAMIAMFALAAAYNYICRSVPRQN